MAGANSQASTGLLKLERELVCFICTEVLYQPLTILDCLHTFCGSCLKIWFSHQHRKASSSRSNTSAHPYTCPTCRANVKDVQHNAMVNTLLEMFLANHPDRGRTEEEKAELQQTYKPGDNILPKVERRRERRARREEDEARARERQMIEEAREQSLRDVQNTTHEERNRLALPSEEHGRDASREREARRERRRERERHRVRRTDDQEGAEIEPFTAEPEPEQPATSPPPSSPLHPDAVEARQREHTMVHQSSLRSLVSASESGTGTGDSLDTARIMQEILSDGLLEGIDVGSLTETEQNVWVERIVQAYRQRYQPQNPTSSPQRPEPRERASDPSSNTLYPLSASDRNQNRSRSRHTVGTAVSPGRNNAAQERPRSSRTHPPASANHLAPPSSVVIAHRRRASDQSRYVAPSQSSPTPSAIQPSRSAIDISSGRTVPEPQTVEQAMQPSEALRTNTDPGHPPRVSDIRLNGGTNAHRSQNTDHVENQPLGAVSTLGPVRTSTNEAHIRTTEDESGHLVQSGISSTVLRQSQQQQSSLLSQGTLQALAQYDEPLISCSRCSRPDIQYEVHKHCEPCRMDICLRCYRAGKGCNHWFGFGHAAMIKFGDLRRNTESVEPPHPLVGRQYIIPEPKTILQTKPGNRNGQTFPVRTTSNPASRLQRGHFCDRCGIFADSQYWRCDYCNEGEWGFCKDCVHSHHCCTHPLLPIAHEKATSGATAHVVGVDEISTLPNLPSSELHSTPALINSRPSSSRSFASSTGPQPNYIFLSITTRCDLCHNPIPPSHSRFHCPFHPSPSPENEHALGDYDICTLCYHKHAKTNQVKRDDGPAGWRKCPSGHRMIITAFEDDPDGGMRRTVKHDLVGGWKMSEEDMAAWMIANSQPSNNEKPQSPPLSGMTTRGVWTWNDDPTTGRRASRARRTTLTSSDLRNNTTTTKFPPDAGFGARARGIWSWYPEEGEDGKGELMFPRGADIAEIEDVNGEWWSGVYAGDIGVGPAGYIQEIGSTNSR